MVSLNTLKACLQQIKEDLDIFSEFGCDPIDLYNLANSVGSVIEDIQWTIEDLRKLLGGDDLVSEA